MLTESACELFLERGFAATSISDIALRAGVSRSSFFNYAASKSALLWVGFDAHVAGLTETLARRSTPGSQAFVREALMELFGDFVPDTLALAYANEEAMGLEVELERESAVRATRIAATIATAVHAQGVPEMSADVVGAAYAGAVMTAIRHWSLAGSGRHSLCDTLEVALSAVSDVTARSESG